MLTSGPGSIRTAAALLLLGVGAPFAVSSAMTSLSEADGDRHPAVVAFLASPPPGDQYFGFGRPFCSGMLLSPRVVLSASHCMIAAQLYQAYGWTISVTNDSVLQVHPSGLYPLDLYPLDTLKVNESVEQIALNPLYDPQRLGGYDHDVSAAVLSQRISLDASAFPALPQLGMLDVRNSLRQLRGATFELLGYGASEKTLPATGPWILTPTGERLVAEVGFDALDTRFIHQSQRASQDQGGACYGDSGGPSLLKSGATTYVVGVTSTGDGPCLATNVATRTDTNEALTFLYGVLAANP